MRKLCPACITRLDRVVHPDCIVCNGNGYMALGEGAVAFYRPEVVAKAVELSLEAVARVADLTGTLSDDRTQAVISVIEKLHEAGLVAEEESPYVNKAWWGQKQQSKQPRNQDGKYASYQEASELAEQAVQAPLIPLDRVMVDAAPYEYAREERPNARGLPVLSANGYPSHLARVADPQEPGRSTAEWVQGRRADQREAMILVQASERAVQRKRRRSQRLETTG